MPIHVAKSADSPSLLPIGVVPGELFPGTEGSHTEPSKGAPPGHFLRVSELSGVAILKIDTQGYELGVLTECDGLMERFAAIYV